MELKTDSSNRVQVISNKPYGKHGCTEHMVKVNGKKNPYIIFNYSKLYLSELEQIEDYQWNLGMGKIGIASQFKVVQEG